MTFEVLHVCNVLGNGELVKGGTRTFEGYTAAPLHRCTYDFHRHCILANVFARVCFSTGFIFSIESCRCDISSLLHYSLLILPCGGGGGYLCCLQLLFLSSNGYYFIGIKNVFATTIHQVTLVLTHHH